MRIDRRRFLERAGTFAAAPLALSAAGAWLASSVRDARADETGGADGRRIGPMAGSPPAVAFGDGELLSLSDGQLTLPVGFLLPDSIDADERAAFLARHGLGPDTVTPPCNVTLWRTPEHLVLFDVGAGTQFMPGAGLLPESLAEAGIDPAEITDVVLTHAHPDHLWGAIDDFDEVAFPEARWHVHRGERDFWLADGTLEKTPEARQAFVVGARNRLARLEERLVAFDWGDEVLPGIEAVDTHGHTPGHTSFALHAGNDSVLVLGDALTNAALSFERPAWPSGADQDPEAGIRTRLSLLDRLAAERSAMLGFHLPAPGFGRAEVDGGAYRFVPDA